MTTLREAAQMALDALIDAEDYVEDGWNTKNAYKAEIDALRAALALPEQTPVAWGVDEGERRCIDLHDVYFVPTDAEHMAELKGNHAKVIPLYTAPPQREWQGLTDEDLSVCDGDGVILARYWEAKLREKNNG